METNAWWLRRVRPYAWGGLASFFVWTYYRYYFFGKNETIRNNLFHSPEELE